MTGRMRRFSLAVGGTVLLLLAIAFLAASFRAAPEGVRQEPGGLAPDRVSMDKAVAGIESLNVPQSGTTQL